MLNKQLVKTSFTFLIFSLLLMMANSATPQQKDSLDQTQPDSTTQLVTFDSSMLKLYGVANGTTAPVITLNKQVVHFADDYIADNGYLLNKIREKYPVYFTIMDSVFNQFGLPQELKYLAIIESKLNTDAISRSGAVGAWQLMPVAARMYSLKIGKGYDERRHFYKSTVAAAKLLQDLYEKFGDWLLVVAAYNSGPGGVYKAIKKAGSRNYWKLQSFLPTETRAHVKRFISTHYYYEQQGSIATVTLEEAMAYRISMKKFQENENNLGKERRLPDPGNDNNEEEKSVITVTTTDPNRREKK